MNLRTPPVRVVAAVGAVLVAGTTLFVALTAGTAAAAEPGRCTENVNVREDPEADARIVALCEAGKAVELGEERDGFVRIDELNGWAAEDFVKPDAPASSSSSSSSGSSSPSTSSADHGGDPDGASRDADRTASTGTATTRSVDAGNAGDPDAGSGLVSGRTAGLLG